MASVGKADSGRNELVDIPDDLVTLVKSIKDEYDREDTQERDNRKQLWLKLENYFHGIQRIYWDATARDYRSVDNSDTALANRHYDKIVNIYRAHAESIIAALSMKPPSAIFYPDDAEVQEDIATAKVCNKIKENIEKQNRAELLLIKSLMILFNQGTVFYYCYNRNDSKYGTYSVPKIGKDPAIQHTTLHNCPECGSNLKEAVSINTKPETDDEEEMMCPTCGYAGVPHKEEYEEEIPEIIGSDLYSKSRTVIEVFSPLFVRVPFYARSQEHIPYLNLRFEQHISAIRELYPNVRKKGISPGIDRRDSEDRGIYIGANNNNLVTVDCWWVRPWAYCLFDNKDTETNRLKKEFPDGFYAIFLDDELVEIANESLDDHWEISQNPLANYIHGDPLGKSLAPIQDLKNEVNDLQIETFEHAIPETFARSDVVDFKKYEKEEARPGMMFPAMPPADGSQLAGAFHTVKTAVISEEYDLFSRRLDEAGQFVSASFPSIYGGPATSGSKTAREYTESRSMALQRLSLPWTMLKHSWAGVMGKAVPLYIKGIKQSGEDEKIVERTKTGFINSWIRQSDLDGRIGRVEADTEEELPQSAAQLKSVIIDLMTLKSDYIDEALYHPNNTPLIAKALGNPDFYIPDADDRNKQYDEFNDLLSGIDVEVREWEKHEVEADTCMAFLTSPTGLIIKKNNIQGYNEIENHMMKHRDMLAKKTPLAPPQSGPGTENPEGAPNEPLANATPPSNVVPFASQSGG